VILKSGGLLVLIVVAVIDERVVLLEMVGGFFADSESMLGEGTDSLVLGVCPALIDELHHVVLCHSDLIIKLMIS
jgi:hypothetical protein